MIVRRQQLENQGKPNTDALQKYAVALDIGISSVGWVAINQNTYRLMRARGKELIGARLFDRADTAAKRRGYRAARRRYSRRSWRLRLLDELFEPAIRQIDPSFFLRRQYSWVHPQDEKTIADKGLNRDSLGYLFPTKDENLAFAHRYPTIYHLRQALINDTEKHDIREIYAALHHLVKYRGHFLTEGEIDTSRVLNDEDVTALVAFAVNLNSTEEPRVSLDTDDLAEEKTSLVPSLEHALTSQGSKSVRADRALEIAKDNFSKETADTLKIVFHALTGLQTDFAKLFSKDELDTEQKKLVSVRFDAEDLDDKLQKIYDSGIFTEEEISVIRMIQTVHSEVELEILLSGETSIADAKVTAFNSHRDHLQTFMSWADQVDNQSSGGEKLTSKVNENYLIMLKRNVRRSGAKAQSTNEKALGNAKKFFCNVKENTILGKPSELFTNEQGLVPFDGKELTIKQFSDLVSDPDQLFPLLRDKNNSVIPHQLSGNEVKKIIEKQAKYYPFLADTFTNRDGKPEYKILGLVNFRVPYFVGPLATQQSVENGGFNGENHWMQRRAGHEHEQITPWNIHEVVDYGRSAEQFIDRLTETDTYLLGEKTLPQHSFSYELFEALNELNNIRVIAQQANRSYEHIRRLTVDEKLVLLDLFKQHKSVSQKRAEEVLSDEFVAAYELKGFATPGKFMASLDSYIEMKKVLSAFMPHSEVSKLVDDESKRDFFDDIVIRQTVFEDEKMRADEILHLLQSSVLDGKGYDLRALAQKFAKTHYTGWGKLSRKFLTSREIRFGSERFSVLQMLEKDNKNLQEILKDDDENTGNHFSQWIEQCNTEWSEKQEHISSEQQFMEELQQRRMSAPVRRGVIQAFRIVQDITSALGCAPSALYIEMADEVQASVRTSRRERQLQDLFKAMKKTSDSSLTKDISELEKQLKDRDVQTTDRLFPYFLQLGKDIYTGEPINIDEISSKYDIDHIIPQSLVKDDSLENRVLTSRPTNGFKSDRSFLWHDGENKPQVRNLWKLLHQNGLMGQKKYNNLSRLADDQLSIVEKQRFVARALVETRQIMTNVADLFRHHYDDQIVVRGLPSTVTHDMRRYLGYAEKDRDINDYHHAQDALCIALAAQFAQNRGFFDSERNSDGNLFNLWLERQKDQYRKQLGKDDGHKAVKPSSAYGFIVGSMRSSSVEKQTNAFTGEVVWDKSNYDYAQHVMNFKKMLITRRSGDIKGNFFNQTIIPRTAPDKKAPTAHGKDPEFYGGFASPLSSYMVLISYVKGKNEVTSLQTFTAQEASLVQSGQKSEEEIIRARGINKFTVLLKHVPVGQLVEYHPAKMGKKMSHLVRLASATELKNAQELWLEHTDYRKLHVFLTEKPENFDLLISRINDSSDPVDVAREACELMRKLMHITHRKYPMFKLPGDENGRIRYFSDLPVEIQQEILQDYVQVLKAPGSAQKKLDKYTYGSNEEKRTIELHFGSRFGRMQSGGASYLFQDNDVFIFQSPSGIFERRMTVAQLKEQAQKNAMNDE